MERFERQRAFFGDPGQHALRATHVGIVGLGGLGSHVAQQLAYLGVGTLTLVDPDRLEETNRNRLIGTRASDPLGTPKVAIAERMVAEIDPGISVSVHQNALQDAPAADALQQVNWVFGCLDNDGARLIMTAMTARRRQPYIDLATEIHVGDRDVEYGGRVCVARNGYGCPYCLDLLDQDEIRRSLADEDQLQDLADIYGMNPSVLGATGPAVVYLNGVIASLGVAEFVAALTGLREPRRVLEYRGSVGVVMVSGDPPTPGCPYCTQVAQAS